MAWGLYFKIMRTALVVCGTEGNALKTGYPENPTIEIEAHVRRAGARLRTPSARRRGCQPCQAGGAGRGTVMTKFRALICALICAVQRPVSELFLRASDRLAPVVPYF
eukprot:SAG31_NODE_3_length_45830_cov_42.279701_6_plen_108_part_00